MFKFINGQYNNVRVMFVRSAIIELIFESFIECYQLIKSNYSGKLSLQLYNEFIL